LQNLKSPCHSLNEEILEGKGDKPKRKEQKMKMFKTALFGFLAFSFLFAPCIGAEIHKASKEGDLAKVQALIAENPGLTDTKDEMGRTPLHLACYGGHTELVKFLLVKGADMEAKFPNGSTALFWTIPEGHKEILELLMAKGADINAKQNDGTSLLHIAAALGQTEIAELLINKGLGPNTKQSVGSTPLVYAVSRGHRKVVELLLNKGADVNIQDNAGYSPVNIAAFRGNKEMLEFLISKGANLNQKNRMGLTALHDMAMQGQKEIVALLIDNGADFMMKDTSGNAALQLASNHGHKDVVELLLTKGADVNQKGSGGDNPLHGAAWKGDKPTVEFLIANNAEINAKNENGETPLDNALRRGHEDIVALLTANKAKRRTGLKMEYKKIVSDQIDQEGMDTPLKFTILYDNYLYEQGTKPDWGFSCLIEGTEKVILFDTGTQPDILLHNVDHLGVDLKKVETIVISHDHHDHIGGLPKVLDRNHDVSVYMPVSFAYEIVRSVESKNAEVVSVDNPVEICPNVYSTGEMGVQIKEQSLIINTKKGLIIVTGCSHQGIVNILKRAKKLFDRPIYLVFGGFHLGGMADAKVEAIIQDFNEIGVEKCGATHCTGDRPIELFKKAFGDNYAPMGTGRILEIKQ
jgi:7,8-dihydropterin-6-yl-methyl-4-(beta-D-ribofuranosyl)aminobenzene 5'-phosphate synthase